MEDIISLTPKQLTGLVWHLNEELARQQVHGDNDRRIIDERTLDFCINCYNSPNIPSSFDEQPELEFSDAMNEDLLSKGFKLTSKDYLSSNTD
jgi:hypothetical protein